MKTQHTPGPWSHIEDYGTPDGTPLRLVKSEREEIAFYVSEANAALIAAAPELLDALEAIVEAGRMSDQARAVYCAAIARAAIARATK